MKFIYSSIKLGLFAFIFFTGFLNPFLKKCDSEFEGLIGQVYQETIKSILKKYDVSPFGTGIAAFQKEISEFSLEFRSNRKLNREELRKMTINFAHELLNVVNSNQDIQVYLTERPFTINRIDIVIYNDNTSPIVDPEICLSAITNGIVRFRTRNPENEMQYKNTYTETYEEALARIR